MQTLPLPVSAPRQCAVPHRLNAGIPGVRLKASATLDGSAQEVRFILGEAPY